MYIHNIHFFIFQLLNLNRSLTQREDFIQVIMPLAQNSTIKFIDQKMAFINVKKNTPSKQT